MLGINLEWKMEEAFSDYQVFINHRGPDTKKNLASLLYQNLDRLGLRVFLDREELRTGNCVYSAIKAAIHTSSVRIAIFSPNYAESQWCLKELCLMLQSSSTIIPIFWDLKPSNLKYVNTGPYAAAFTKHEDESTMEVERWKEALKTAAGIKGHEFHTEKDDWGEFVSKIVDIVHEKVRRELPLFVANHPVGLLKPEENLSIEILKQMKSSAGATIVGIAGLYGSGKTTLVTHLYNCFKHSDFNGFSFLDSVSKKKLTSLQKKLLFDLGFPGPCRRWRITTKEGETLIRQVVKGRPRVLIVLDEIYCQEQIDSLVVVAKDVIGDGSLIVITSRDKELLDRCRVSYMYTMKLLDAKDARELFRHHAFPELKAQIVSEDLVREMVKMCGGYPLALKVLGEQLRGKQERKWKGLLINLRKNLFPNEVEKIVKASYDSLKPEEQLILWLAASFFEGSDTQLILSVDEQVECPLLDWFEILDQKCLVELHNIDDEDLWKEHEMEAYARCSSYKCYKIVIPRFIKSIVKNIVSKEFSQRSLENIMIPTHYNISMDLVEQWWTLWKLSNELRRVSGSNHIITHLNDLQKFLNSFENKIYLDHMTMMIIHQYPENILLNLIKIFYLEIFLKSEVFCKGA